MKLVFKKLMIGTIYPDLCFNCKDLYKICTGYTTDFRKRILCSGFKSSFKRIV